MSDYTKQLQALETAQALGLQRLQFQVTDVRARELLYGLVDAAKKPERSELTFVERPHETLVAGTVDALARIVGGDRYRYACAVWELEKTRVIEWYEGVYERRTVIVGGGMSRDGKHMQIAVHPAVWKAVVSERSCKTEDAPCEPSPE
jgi:hypothetical protein